MPIRIQLITLMQIRILIHLITLMRIRILPFNLMQIRIHTYWRVLYEPLMLKLPGQIVVELQVWRILRLKRNAAIRQPFSDTHERADNQRRRLHLFLLLFPLLAFSAWFLDRAYCCSFFFTAGPCRAATIWIVAWLFCTYRFWRAFGRNSVGSWMCGAGRFGCWRSCSFIPKSKAFRSLKI